MMGKTVVDRRVAALRQFALDVGEWVGTAADLLAKVTPADPPRGWPDTPRGLRSAIDRATPALRSVGVEVVTEEQLAAKCARRSLRRDHLVAFDSMP